MSIRVLIADDHSVVRQGLRMFLALDPEFEVVGEAADGAEALRLAHELNPDVVLMDINLPGMNGVECVRQLKGIVPEVQVVPLSIEWAHRLEPTTDQARPPIHATSQ